MHGGDNIFVSCKTSRVKIGEHLHNCRINSFLPNFVSGFTESEQLVVIEARRITRKNYKPGGRLKLNRKRNKIVHRWIGLPVERTSVYSRKLNRGKIRRSRKRDSYVHKDDKSACARIRWMSRCPGFMARSCYRD